MTGSRERDLRVSLDSAPDLPPILAQIAEAAGLPAALKLAHARGGRTVTIPQKAPGTILAKIVGIDEATKIIEAFGAGDLDIPLGHIGAFKTQARARRKGVQAAIEAGASVREAAGKTGVHMRTVKRVKAQMREAGTLPLFDK